MYPELVIIEFLNVFFPDKQVSTTSSAQLKIFPRNPTLTSRTAISRHSLRFFQRQLLLPLLKTVGIPCNEYHGAIQNVKRCFMCRSIRQAILSNAREAGA